MSYRIYQFDGLYLSELVQANDSSDMGTGAALTSYNQLPGGGFFDNYGVRKSPQGIRPITKSYLLEGDTEEELKDAIDAVRAKIGVSGKLTVRMGDGSLRWQWARMRNVQMARSINIPQLFQPVRISWETASQHWYGLIQGGTGWTWGDGTWLWGDGTAEFGANDETYTITGVSQAEVLTNNGNIRTRNLRVIVDYTAGSSSNDGFTITSGTTGHYVSWSGNLAVGESLQIDTGKQSIEQYEIAKTIAAIQGTGDVILCETSGVHGYTSGDNVVIDGTDNYDLVYSDITVLTTTSFSAQVDPSLNVATIETTGTARRSTDEYDNTIITDKQTWLALAPGDNTVTMTLDTFNNNYDVTFRWYDHYA